MEYTKNYQLPQWVETDRIQMQDFNNMAAKIDSALGKQAKTLLGLGKCRVELLTYTGTGKCGADNPNRLTFSGVPKLLIIIGDRDFAMGVGGAQNGPAVMSSGAYAHNTTISYTWKGNVVEYYCSVVDGQMNSSGRTYYVVAFYAEDQCGVHAWNNGLRSGYCNCTGKLITIEYKLLSTAKSPRTFVRGLSPASYL